MKPRQTLLGRLTSLFQRKKSQPVKPERMRRHSSSSKIRGIEPLEGRIAPASLIDNSTVMYKDVGGDTVTIHFSSPVLYGLTPAELNEVFKFSAGTFADDVEQDLQALNLGAVATTGIPPQSTAIGVSIDITATKTEGMGDDLVKIGAIRAGGISLGDVTIDGDLGQIDCGVASSKIALRSLTAASIYKFGAATQPSSISAADALESKIVGGIGTLHITGDFFGQLQVTNGTSIVKKSIKITAPGNVDSIVIDGSIIGAVAVGTASANTGLIKIAGDLDSLTIKGVGDGATTGGLIGGGGDNSGAIIVTGDINTVKIVDSIIGGGGANSGAVISSKTINSATIGDDVVGGVGKTSGSIQGADIKSVVVSDSIIGGGGELSGVINASKTLTAASVGHNLTGGGGKNSGNVRGAIITNASIGESIIGAGGELSGAIIATGKIVKATVTQDVNGGDGKNSGGIRGLELGAVTIGHKLAGGAGEGSGVIYGEKTIESVIVTNDIVGGAGISSGGISTDGRAESVVIKGDIVGGGVLLSGFVSSQKTINSVTVYGELHGGVGDRSAVIISAGTIEKVVVGKLVGNTGPNSGAIIGATDPETNGELKSVTVAQGIVGGAGVGSGSVLSHGSIGSVAIGTTAAPLSVVVAGGEGQFSGSIVAQTTIGKAGKKPTGVVVLGSVSGGNGDYSAMIQSSGLTALVDIRDSLNGGAGDGSGSIRSLDVFDGEEFTKAGDLGTVRIGGNIIGGAGDFSGRIEAAGDAGIISVNALVGGTGANSGSVVTGFGFVNLGDVKSLDFSGAIQKTESGVKPVVSIGGQLKSLAVDGGLDGAEVRVGRDLIKAVIGTGITDSTVSAFGSAAAKLSAKKGDIAIGSLTVNGAVDHSQILAGYDVFGGAANADASIGSVVVKGNWTASNLIAGVQDVDEDGFGDADDVRIVGGVDRSDFISTIAKIQIDGVVAGTVEGDDHFGFEAERILSVKAGSTKLAFNKLADGQSFDLVAGDLTAREVTA